MNSFGPQYALAATKGNTLELQESVEALQAACGIAWTSVGIAIVRVEGLNRTLIDLAFGLEADGAAESSLGLIVAELDEVTILAADIDAVGEVVLADIVQINIVLLLLAVNARGTGRKGVELMPVDLRCPVGACEAQVTCLGSSEESGQGDDGKLHCVQFVVDMSGELMLSCCASD